MLPLWVFHMPEANLGGGGAVGSTWILTDAASPGIFLVLKFRTQSRKDLTFLLHELFPFGRCDRDPKLLFSPGPFPSFLEFLCFALDTERPLLLFVGSDSEVRLVCQE